MSEKTPSGVEILRHRAAVPDRSVSPEEGGRREAFERHMERVLGGDVLVFHELISDVVHIDVYVYPPTPDRPFTVLATCGMSDLPMHVPEAFEQATLAETGVSLRYAEVLLALPPEWPLTKEAFEDERHYWPLRLLKGVARMPHLYSTWLGIGHTIPNGDPASPYAPDTQLSGLVLLPPVLDELSELADPEAVSELRFLAVVPLTDAEMELKLNEGLDALLERFNAHGVNELLDPHRESLVP